MQFTELNINVWKKYSAQSVFGDKGKQKYSIILFYQVMIMINSYDNRGLMSLKP